MTRPWLLILGLLLGQGSAGWAANNADLLRLLRGEPCRGCLLSDADLVHADLRDVDLQQAHLQRANLGEARLDGADLREADLSFTNLYGASLRGADLRGSRLFGTDLRGADLSGAQLDVGALEQSHWQGARGVADGILNHADLHNSGVDAAQAGEWQEAERLFAAAILRKPSEPLSWVARGLSRGEQGKNDLAAKDLAHAGRLFAEQGDPVKADQLLEASQRAQAQLPDTTGPNGNGVGSTLLSGALSAAQLLGPIALKALMPMIP